MQKEEFQVFLQFCKKKPGNLWLKDGHFITLSGHFFVNYINVFQKTEIQMVNLRCLVGLNLNWIKSYGIISVQVIFFHAWKCIISGLFWKSEIWHLLSKPALTFSNDYVQTPSIHHFKGFFMKILQYEIKNCQKVNNKGTRRHSIWYEF